MSVFTFPIVWRAPLAEFPLQNPVWSGPNVLVIEGMKLHAFARGDGRSAWSAERAGNILPVVAVAGGCVAATAEVDGMRIERFADDGRVLWELPGRWNLCPQGLVGASERFLLAGRRRDAMNDPRLWEMSAADATILRSVPGSSRPGAIAIDGGWAWVDDSERELRLRVLDGDGARVIATGEVRALAATGEWLLADGASVLRAHRRGQLVWERPGGKTSNVAADARGVACGHLDGDGLWICAYGFDGALQWKAGPWPDGYPTIVFWNDLVIASGIYLGEGDAVAVFDRADGRVLAIESGGWASGWGSLAIDGEAVYVSGGGQLARRERRAWKRIEDAWDPAYTIAVAAQLDDGEDDRLARELTALRAAGVTASQLLREVALTEPPPDLAALRDAIAAARAAGRATCDRLADAVAWMFSDADWPLWALDLPADVPEHRVELIMFDSEVDGPLWDERARIASYPQLRLLSLRSNRLDGALGIDLAALPRLEYLSLSENALERVPPELRACRSLIHLNLRDNRLASIDPADLPSSLRWLDVGQNQLSEAMVARLRAALPACKVHSYAQRPVNRP